MVNSYTWKSKTFTAPAFDAEQARQKAVKFLNEQNLSMLHVYITETFISGVVATENRVNVTVWYRKEEMSDSAVNERIEKIAEQMDGELVGGKQIL